MEWSNEPPPDATHGAVRLIRVPAQGVLRGIILSTDLKGTPTHYDGTRTQPCARESCELCSRGLPWRWHGYVGLLIVGTQERVVLELTAAASQRLADHARQNGTLRGFDLIAQRPKGKANSRIAIQLGALQRPSTSLPPDPDIPALMAYIWGTASNGQQMRRRPTPELDTEQPDQHHPQARNLPPEARDIGKIP